MLVLKVDNIVIRKSNYEDVYYLKDKLRASDAEEVWCSHHHTTYEALKLSLDNSNISFTVELNNEPIMMFGVSSESVLSSSAIIWMLSSDKINNIRIKFIRQNINFIKYLLNIYPVMYNYVDARNKKSIQWLKYLGAKIEEAKPYGIEKMMFHKFYFIK